MHRSLSLSLPRNKISVLLLALGFVSGACHFTSATVNDGVDVRVEEVLVWNDRMPGSPERAHALVRLALTNRTGTPICLTVADALIATAPDDRPLRRFRAEMLVDNALQAVVTLPPSRTTLLTLRSPRGVPPIDAAAAHAVRVLAVLSTDAGGPLTVRTDTVRVFITE